MDREILYHGTPYPKDVLREGLIPNKQRNFEASVDGYLYLAFTPSFSYGYAEMEPIGPERGRVLEVCVPEPEKVEADPDSSAARYPGYIPPENIELLFDSKEEEVEELGYDTSPAGVVSEEEELVLEDELPEAVQVQMDERLANPLVGDLNDG